MATSQSMTNEPRPSRPPPSTDPTPPPPSDEDVETDDLRGEESAGDGSSYLYGPAFDAIEVERDRLMAADSVLACLQVALDPEAVTVRPAPYFPEVVRIARKLIGKSIRRLDAHEIGPLIDRVKD
ncbi:MAG: hypothetical protein ACREU3_05015 [Steroidobacteraceae bacterium]